MGEELHCIRWHSDKESACQCRRCKTCGFDLWVRKTPLEKKMATYSSILGKILGNPRDRGTCRATVHGVTKESDLIERMSATKYTSLYPSFSLSLFFFPSSRILGDLFFSSFYFHYFFLESESESHSVVSDSLQPHGILQARILEWVAFPFSRGSSQPRDRIQVSRIAGRFFTN